MDKKILVIPDIHFPYHSQHILAKIYSLAKRLQPDYIVQIGDLYDFFSASKYPGKRIITPQDEVTSARQEAELMWFWIKKLSPKSECYQIKGNHCNRPQKRLLEKAPELAPFFNDKWMWVFDGVNTIHDPREELEIENILFIHGWLTRPGDHARYFMRSVVRGHDHKGWLVFLGNFGGHGGSIYELSVGFAGDRFSVPLSYTATKRMTQWNAGAGLIDSLGPRFILL